MTSRRLRRFALSSALSLALGVAGAASGHEAHRKSEPVAPEVEEGERALRSDLPESPRPPETVEAPAADSLHEAAGAHPEHVSPTARLGRLHPVAIHFPIALFLAALVAEVLFAATREELFRHALRFSLWGGALSAIIAAPLGWMFAASGATEAGWLLETHRWTGIAAAILGLAVLWVAERTERRNGGRSILRVVLTLQALLIGGAGFFGGALLYGIDHLWRGA